ncbi:MAG: hypothetical protein NTX25_04580 [Proteobacteria bacterium]|nr:hypothetical protein [Pseudomonadota bacterium]
MKNMIYSLVFASLTVSSTASIKAESLPSVCEVKIAKPTEVTPCFAWKNSAGKPVDISGRDDPHTLKMSLPDGRSFTLPAQSVIMFSNKAGVVESIDFHLPGEDMTYAEAVKKLISSFQELGLYDKVNNKTITRMLSEPGQTLYPKAALGNTISLTGTVKKSVLTTIPEKDQTPNAKMWRVQFRLFYAERDLSK